MLPRETIVPPKTQPVPPQKDNVLDVVGQAPKREAQSLAAEIACMMIPGLTRPKQVGRTLPLEKNGKQKGTTSSQRTQVCTWTHVRQSKLVPIDQTINPSEKENILSQREMPVSAYI